MRSMPLPLSSGDPLMDRRLEWARGLMEAGEAGAAAALLAETTAAAPGFLAAWFALGEACAQAGAVREAAAAFRHALNAEGRRVRHLFQGVLRSSAGQWVNA